MQSINDVCTECTSGFYAPVMECFGPKESNDKTVDTSDKDDENKKVGKKEDKHNEATAMARDTRKNSSL